MKHKLLLTFLALLLGTSPSAWAQTIQSQSFEGTGTGLQLLQLGVGEVLGSTPLPD